MLTPSATPAAASTHPFAWLWRVWFQPRAVTQAMLRLEERDERVVVFLGFFWGWITGLPDILEQPWREAISAGLLTFFVGPVIGFLYLYVGGALLRRTGHWLGGQATAFGARLALALAMLPHIAFGVLQFLVQFGLTSVFAAPLRARSTLDFWGGLEIVIALWGFVIFFKSLSEAHQFSLGRAVLAWGLAGIVLIGPWLACGLILILSEFLVRLVFS